jgi:DNA invertase Pin-like site-specific DNA recombinase
VSTYGQTLDSQLEQLRKARCTSRNTYREKVTGARADRRELNRMLGKLAPGGVVTVTRIDRLARSTLDPFAIVKQIVDAKAQFRSLAEPWADTGTSTGRLMIPFSAAWRTWSATLSAPAPPRAAAGRRNAGNAWAGNRN